MTKRKKKEGQREGERTADQIEKKEGSRTKKKNFSSFRFLNFYIVAGYL